MWIAITLAILFVIGIVLYMKIRRTNGFDFSKEIELPTYEMPSAQDISRKLSVNDSIFTIEGKENRFIITKDDRFEFLVENGLIVACKDLNRHEVFIYYEEVNSQ
ncbi:hypothetical protein [Sporosarcina sp. OR05]|uniref:hypothetical protein n=1 Tax=Sporosarcina sp. OR05 TaxID=2969819 RepID=UPI00352BC8E3